MIDVIRERGPQAAVTYLSTDITNTDLSNMVRKMYLEVGLRHARKEYRRQRDEIRKEPKRKSFLIRMVNKGGVFTLPIQTKAFGFNEAWTQFILQYLQQFLIDKITFQVSANTRDKLLDVLQEGIAEGWGIDEMVKRLEDLPFLRYQAARITRTEINRAANVGTMAGVDTSEYEMNKEWIAAHDVRTRGVDPKDKADHYRMDGQVIDFAEKFKDPRSGEELEFPGDPKANAGQTVNCRCSVAPIAKRDEQGRLIPKPQPAVRVPMIGIYKPPIAAQPFQMVLDNIRPIN